VNATEKHKSSPQNSPKNRSGASQIKLSHNGTTNGGRFSLPPIVSGQFFEQFVYLKNFVYNSKMGLYTNLILDTSELYEIHKGGFFEY